MNVGVEIKQDEYRVALDSLERSTCGTGTTSSSSRARAREAHSWTSVGSQVRRRIGSVEEVWADSELVLKVKEPIPEEFGRLREGQSCLASTSRPARSFTRALMESGAACVAYETVRDRRSRAAASSSDERDRRTPRSQAGATFLEAARGRGC